jgi:hypothetical protein
MALGAYDREQRYLARNYGLGTVLDDEDEEVTVLMRPDGELTARQRRRRDKKVSHAVRKRGLNHEDTASVETRLSRSGSPVKREAAGIMAWAENVLGPDEQSRVMHKLRTDGGTDWDRLHSGELRLP